MLRRLNIRSKLLLTIVLPLFAIAALAGVVYPTFQTVKVNGPQYEKIKAAKDIEADILPPPAYFIEAHLDASLIVDTDNAAEIGRLTRELKRLEGEFKDRHGVWQRALSTSDPMRATMADASAVGTQYFAAIDRDLIPLTAKIATTTDRAAQSKLRTQAKALFTGPLAKLYATHRSAIDETVVLSRARQAKVEKDTSSLVSNRLSILIASALGLFGLTALTGLAVARSINRPVRVLTQSARRAAEVDLPAIVEQIQDGHINEVPKPVSPFSGGSDELSELSRALDSMQGTAIDLAVEQARVRRNVSDNLVTVGRRNQGLLRRTLSFVSQMEQDERDAGKLDQLFRLDHLTTRMRRNAESLLVLAGAEQARVWAQATEIGDVVRIALSQVESYDRVDFGRLEGGRMKGHVVSDVSHLLAELIENATYFSPPSTRVTVLGKLRQDGYLVVVSDDGVGMSEDEMRIANAHIANPQDFDAEPTKVLGLVVVGRLAKRCGIRVRLAESATTGVAAQILIPLSLLEHDAAIGVDGASTPMDHADIRDLVHGELPATDELSHAFDSHDIAGRSVDAFAAAAAAMTSPATFQATSERTATDDLPEIGHSEADEALRSLIDSYEAPTIAGSSGQHVPGDDSLHEASLPTAPVEAVPGPKGLTTRVRGAQLPDTGPAATQPAIQRDAQEVRASLSSLQKGFSAGRESQPNDSTNSGDLS